MSVMSVWIPRVSVTSLRLTHVIVFDISCRIHLSIICRYEVRIAIIMLRIQKYTLNKLNISAVCQQTASRLFAYDDDRFQCAGSNPSIVCLCVHRAKYCNLIGDRMFVHVSASRLRKYEVDGWC